MTKQLEIVVRFFVEVEIGEDFDESTASDLYVDLPEQALTVIRPDNEPWPTTTIEYETMQVEII